MLGSIELFCLAAEAGSFTAAASLAGVTPAAVSRSVARLEARLGVRLFVRSTRRISLSEAGRRYFEHCREALGQLREAEREVSGSQQQPSGRLRVSLPTTYAHYRVLPQLAAFRARYPELSLELHLSNRNIDFAEEGFDLAVRVRQPADSTLVARKLEDAALVVVAAPDYLHRAGWPETPEALAAHECIQFEMPSSGRVIPWLFRIGGQEQEWPVAGALTCSGDVLGGVTLARHGAGLFQTYRFIVEDDLRAGRLMEVLPAYAGSARPFNVIYPHARHLPLRVRVFADFLLGLAGSAAG